MKWLIILISIYLFFYIHNIYRYLKTLSEVDHLLEVFSKVNKELNQQNVEFKYLIDASPIRKDLIQEMPRINFVLPYSFDSLTINQNNEQLYDSFSSILSKLVTKRDEMYYNRRSAFNPINPLKRIFLIPSSILSWFGINISQTAQRVSSLIIWIFGFLFKEFLSGSLDSIIQNFFK